MARRAFVIGGTGQIGRAIGHELLADGWEVTLSHRGRRPAPDDLVRRGARLVLLDRNELGALSRAVGSGADAVIDTVAFTDVHANQLLEIESSIGALVVISSSSVYRDEAGRTLDEARTGGFPDMPLPLTEAHPTVEPGPKTYSNRKIALERRLLDLATGAVTILRPSAIHGPHSVHPREWWFVKRMLDWTQADSAGLPGRKPVSHLGNRQHRRSDSADVGGSGNTNSQRGRPTRFERG